MVASDKEREKPSGKEPGKVIGRLLGRKEVEVIPEVPPEIERAQPLPGAAHQLTKPVVDDQTGQVLVTSPAAQPPKIVLPLTKEEIERGLGAKLTNSVRWLAVWCIRAAKKMGSKIIFKRKKS